MTDSPLRNLIAFGLLSHACLLASVGPAQAQAARTVGEGTRLTDESFTMLGGLVELGGGDLVLLDRGERKVLRLMPASGRVSELARRGSGPQEVAYPVRVLPVGDGRAVVVDAQNERWLVVTSEGAAGDFYRLGTDGETSRVARRATGLAMLNGDIIYETANGRTTEIVRWTSRDNRVTTLATRQLVVSRDQSSGAVAGAVATAGAASPRAYPTLPDLWTSSPDGFTAIVSSEPYRLSIIADDGSRVDGAPIPLEGFKATARTRAVMTEELLTQRGRQAPPDGRYEWPALLPAFHTDRFQTLFFAPDGKVWVRRTMPAEQLPTFDVFSRKAVRVEQVRLPANTRLLGIGKGALYLVKRDDDGLEYVYRSPFRH